MKAVGPELSFVLVDGSCAGATAVGGVAVGATTATGAGVAVGAAVGAVVGAVVGAAVGAPVGVGVTGAATTTELTVAWHRTSAPPPFAEPLHWSTLTGSTEVVVELVVTVQTKPTLVPPFPELLHCPTVAAETDVTPGVFTGVQVPGAPGPVMTDPMHW